MKYQTASLALFLLLTNGEALASKETGWRITGLRQQEVILRTNALPSASVCGYWYVEDFDGGRSRRVESEVRGYYQIDFGTKVCFVNATDVRVDRRKAPSNQGDLEAPIPATTRAIR